MTKVRNRSLAGTVKKLYISILMKVFNHNQINQKKLKRFVASRQSEDKGQRTEKYTDLSIIIPCYNHAPFLPATFESITNQTRLPGEVIFVDDASKDETQQVLARLIAAYNNPAVQFKVIHQPQNKGQAAAINAGVEAAGNELVMVLNDDDYLMHDAVAHTINIFNDEKDIYLLGSKAIRVYDEQFLNNMKKKSIDFTVSEVIRIIKYDPQVLLNEYHAKGIDMTHSAMSFSKVAWQSVGGYKTRRRERVIIYTDRDFQIRVSLIYPIAVAPDTPLSFWRSSSSVDAGLYT
jgi:glycosyltransferase involved in cell wall biosynthesis